MSHPPDRVAVLVHGFLRTGAAMAWIGRQLRLDGYKDVRLPTFGYHLHPLAVTGARAAAVLRGVRAAHPTATIDIVTHSFGGVLIRQALGEPDVPTIRRIVMLAPPNQGATMAARVRTMLPVHTLGWDPLYQLLPGVPTLCPTPDAETGILTGGRGNRAGYNASLGADNDFLVRVDEAQLAGSRDFLVIPVPHALLPFHSASVRQVITFLQTGHFDHPPNEVLPAAEAPN